MHSSESEEYPENDRRELHGFIPATTRYLLDVGCNSGAFGEALKKRSDVVVWGIEPNPIAAAKAVKRIDRVFQGLFEPDLDLENQKFDVISFNDVLEHMPRPEDALTLAKSKLAKGGIVVASVPNILHIENLQHMLIDRDFKYEKFGVRDKTHLRFFTQISIRRLFQQAGYVVLTIEGINEAWWSPNLIRRLVFRIFPKIFSETKHMQIAVVAQPARKLI